MISQKDTEILRELAKKQLEYAHLPKMDRLKNDWVLLNTCKGSKPMVTVEINTFYEEIIPERMRCEGDEARRIEQALYFNILNHELFDDDTVVKDYFPVMYQHYFKPFNIDIEVTHLEKSLGHHFTEFIKDFKEDRHLLKKSSFGILKDNHVPYLNMVNDIFGDILPVKLIGSCLYASVTQNLVHVMSMETMFTAMYDYPELFKEVMNNLSNDYLEYFYALEKEGVLLPTTGGEWLAQGTFCYNDEQKNAGAITTKDVWGYLDSQETVGISPDMFAEFIFPYYKKISDCYGLLSYGCCEPVDPFWEDCLSTMPNLRKISISPWCNEEYMGEQLKGKKIVYLRKPSPNFLGVNKELDEDKLRAHIKKTVNAAKGCTLEFSQRDVYTIHSNPQKVRRYVEIIREETV